MRIFKAIIFKIYRQFNRFHNYIKIEHYKYLWRENVIFGQKFQFDSTSNLSLLSGKCKVTFGTNVIFRNYCNIICGANGILSVGKNVFFNNYSSINCLKNISIGDDTIFGEGVRLYDHNHSYQKDINIRLQDMKLGDIEIGSNCWVGSNTIILANVKIGNNVVIGANNLIYKSIPDNTIVKSKNEKIISSRL